MRRTGSDRPTRTRYPYRHGLQLFTPIEPPPPAPSRPASRLTILAEWLRACYLTRFSLLVLLALLLIGPAGTLWMPSMLGALFLLSTPLQMLWVATTSLLVAAMARVSWGVTLLNAPRRFHDCVHISRDCLRFSPWDWLPVSVIGLLPPMYCFFATRADWLRAGLDHFPAYAYLVAMATALVGVTLVLLVATAAQERLSGQEQESPGLLPFEWLPSMDRLRNRPVPAFVLHFEAPLARLLSHLGPGYTRTQYDPYSGRTMQRLGPGHFQSVVCMLATFAAYVLLGRLASSLQIEQPWYPPAICLAMLTLLLLGWALTALAFFLDRFRVPVMFTALGVSWFSYWGFGLDHYYEVRFAEASSTLASPAFKSGEPAATTPAIAAAPRPPRLEEIIHPGWRIPRGADRQRTLIVVTASGGGIQASAWTAQVLCGLHERYPRHFAQSLGLISGVSGGSVGTMFYLVHLQSQRDPLDDNATAAVLRASRSSSLDAAAWGITYPDLVRNIAPPLTEYLYAKYTDRGRAIELAWNRFVTPSQSAIIGRTDVAMDDLVEPMKQHKLPVFVFNSVIVETGQRLLISPVCQEFDQKKGSAEPQEFLDLYRGARLALATGARLSATFPFVSPICRPTPSSQILEQQAYHVADGAYADNEGIVTAVDWTNQLCEYYTRPENEMRRPFDRVLFVRIQPFPTKQLKPAQTGKGWKFAVTGPLTGMLNVRQASQAERGNLETDLLIATRHLQNEAFHLQAQTDEARKLAQHYAPREEALKLRAAISEQQQTATTGPSRLPYTATNARTSHFHRHQHGQREGICVDSITITFPLPDSDEVLPLSWKLSEFDKQRIDRAWAKVLAAANTEGSPINTLDQIFPVPKEK